MKDIKIELSASNASGEAYWRKRCDTVEAELARLRAEVKRLKEAISPAYVETLPDGTALIMTKAVKTEILRLRAVNTELMKAMQILITSCGSIRSEAIANARAAISRAEQAGEDEGSGK